MPPFEAMAPTCCLIMITCSGWQITLLAIEAPVIS
jgi:predicted ATP-grasp superfamily ATP-dependent carboligase